MYFFFIKLTKCLILAVSNKSGLKLFKLKYSNIFIRLERKLFLPVEGRPNDIKKDCLTKEYSFLFLRYRM